MAGKSKIEYPFKVIGMIPKGHVLGQKNRDSFRSRLFKSETLANQEVDCYNRMGISSQKIKR